MLLQDLALARPRNLAKPGQMSTYTLFTTSDTAIIVVIIINFMLPPVRPLCLSRSRACVCVCVCVAKMHAARNRRVSCATATPMLGRNGFMKQESSVRTAPTPATLSATKIRSSVCLGFCQCVCVCVCVPRSDHKRTSHMAQERAYAFK